MTEIERKRIPNLSLSNRQQARTGSALVYTLHAATIAVSANMCPETARLKDCSETSHSKPEQLGYALAYSLIILHATNIAVLANA